MASTSASVYTILLVGPPGGDPHPVRALARTGDIAVVTCASAAEADAWLHTKHADVVLVDCTRGPACLHGLAHLCTCQSQMPVMALGLSTRGATGVEALRCGAHDVLFLDTLTAETLQQALEVATTRQRKTAAVHDALVRDQHYLAETAMAFIELSPEADIFRFIAERLHQLVDGAIVSVTSYDPQTDVLRLRHILGLGHTLSSLATLVGHAPAGLTFGAPSPEVRRAAISGALVQLAGGLHEACGGRFTPETCDTICRVLHLEEFYVAGFTRKGSFFGTAAILLPRGVALTNRAAVEAFLGLCSIALQHRQAEADLREQSLRDDLTGLYNRRGFFAVAEQQLKSARRTRAPLSLLYLDLDGLKQINDQYGHQLGDEALSELAAICRELLRASDIVARLGGDEFVILAPDCPRAESARIAARLQARLVRRNAARVRPYTLAVSIGVGCYEPPGAMTVDQLLGEADRAMYGQKTLRRAGAARHAAKK